MTIVNVRGTNGAGKTYVARQFTARARPIYGAMLGYKAPEAYRLDGLGLDRPLFLIGPYRPYREIGGCDCVQPYSNIIKLLDRYEPQGHIVFEGSLISDHFGKVGEWLTLRGREAVVAFLSTPLEECLTRLRARTPGAGERNVETRFHAIRRVRDRFIREDKVRVVDIDSETGADLILGLLRGNLAAPVTTMPVGAPLPRWKGIPRH